MGDEGAQSQDMIMRMMSRNNTSEKLLEQIDDAVKKVSDEAYATALKQISDNREATDKVVEILCEKETMSGDEFRAILAEYTVIPEENLEAARAHRDHQLDSPPRPPPASLRPLRGASAHARPVKIGNTIIGTRAPSGRCGAARI